MRKLTNEVFAVTLAFASVSKVRITFPKNILRWLRALKTVQV